MIGNTEVSCVNTLVRGYLLPGGGVRDLGSGCNEQTLTPLKACEKPLTSP